MTASRRRKCINELMMQRRKEFKINDDIADRKIGFFCLASSYTYFSYFSSLVFLYDHHRINGVIFVVGTNTFQEKKLNEKHSTA